jgi:hypothetical protein
MAITKKIALSSALIAVITLSVLAGASTASATPGPKGQRKVVICHATSSHRNPYTVNKVDKSSIDEVNNKYLNGHGDHKGGVWYEGVTDHSWGDIIPPFTNDAGNSYLGQNWTAEGKKIYDNGCKPVAQTPTPNTVVGGHVLGASTTVAAPAKKSGILAETGTPLALNLVVGGSILGAAGYLTCKKSRQSTL